MSVGSNVPFNQSLKGVYSTYKFRVSTGYLTVHPFQSEDVYIQNIGYLGHKDPLFMGEHSPGLVKFGDEKNTVGM